MCGGGYSFYPLVSLSLLLSLWALIYVMVIAALLCIDEDEVEVVECIYLSIWRETEPFTGLISTLTCFIF